MLTETVEVIAADPARECQEGWKGYIYKYDEKAGVCKLDPLPFVLLGFIALGIWIVK